MTSFFQFPELLGVIIKIKRLPGKQLLQFSFLSPEQVLHVGWHGSHFSSSNDKRKQELRQNQMTRAAEIIGNMAKWRGNKLKSSTFLQCSFFVYLKGLKMKSSQTVNILTYCFWSVSQDRRRAVVRSRTRPSSVRTRLHRSHSRLHVALRRFDSFCDRAHTLLHPERNRPRNDPHTLHLQNHKITIRTLLFKKQNKKKVEAECWNQIIL